MKYVKIQTAHKTQYKLKIQAEIIIGWRQNKRPEKVAQMAGYKKHKIPGISKYHNIIKTIIIIGYLSLNDILQILDLTVHRQYKESIRKS